MKLRFTLLALVALAGCLSGAPGDEATVSTTDQEVQSCSSQCLAPTYNGVPVSCTSNTSCIGNPEAAYCLNDDGSYFIAACQPRACGDHVCTRPYEDVTSCPADCATCGDFVCTPGEESWCFQDCLVCPAGQGDCCHTGVCTSFQLCSKPGYCEMF